MHFKKYSAIALLLFSLSCQNIEDIRPEPYVYHSPPAKQIELSCSTDNTLEINGVASSYKIISQNNYYYSQSIIHTVWRDFNNTEIHFFYQNRTLNNVNLKIIPFTTSLSNLGSNNIAMYINSYSNQYISDTGSFKCTKTGMLGFCNASFKNNNAGSKISASITVE